MRTSSRRSAPLPVGMQDRLPPDAAARRTHNGMLLDAFRRHGYLLVDPPVFELSSVLERGLGTVDPAMLLRFVDPESGEVVTLRPDMTPQVARIVASRLGDKPLPLRLAYEGAVVRRPSSRGRTHRQIQQVGVELVGVAGREGEIELLEAAAAGLEAVGLDDYLFDLGDAGVVRSLLVGADSEMSERLTDALARRDAGEVAHWAQPLPHRDLLTALPTLRGGRDAGVELIERARGTDAEAPARRLLALYDDVSARALAPRITLDAGEVRGLSYYTTTLLQVFAAGYGGAIASGGRYDDLLGRFGAPNPAAGIGFDVEAVLEARRASGAIDGEPLTVVVVGGPSDRASRLRREGVCAVEAHSRAAALGYARGWGYRFVLEGSELVDVASGRTGPWDDGDEPIRQLQSHARAVGG